MMSAEVLSIFLTGECSPTEKILQWRRSRLHRAGKGSVTGPCRARVRELQWLRPRSSRSAPTRQGSKNLCGCRRRRRRTLRDEAVPEIIGISGSNLIERMRERRKKRTCRPPLPDDKLVRQLQHRVLC
jgi:hypothetical protein